MEGQGGKEGAETPGEDVAMPQKKYYRQRAHSNPLADHNFPIVPVMPAKMDWSEFYPQKCPCSDGSGLQVEFLDVGCGYGGLLIELAPLFPEKLMLGVEIRIKVSDYVRDRIKALRLKHPGQYQNVSVLRSNAMKFLPNYFRKGQLTKMFFLYPDPHFKKQKHKWRVINKTLLAEYAFVLAPGGLLYTITDVVDLHLWMTKYLDEHPLFVRLTEEELNMDPVVPLLYTSTEEGKKVARNKAANKNHGDGDVRVAVYRRLPNP